MPRVKRPVRGYAFPDEAGLMRAAVAGLWVPCYYGNRFKVCRLRANRGQETSLEVWRTLREARQECDRRNGGHDSLLVVEDVAT